MIAVDRDEYDPTRVVVTLHWRGSVLFRFGLSETWPSAAAGFVLALVIFGAGVGAGFLMGVAL
jgi:hypothetical protein